MPDISPELLERLRQLRMLALDVDGVLTDGRLVYLPDGSLHPSGFHVHDGMAVRVALESGLKVIFVSGNWTDAVRTRAEHLRVTAHYLGVGNKVEAMNQASEEHGVPLEQFAYVGDDLNDLAPMRMAGVAVAVADAVDEVKQAADYVCGRAGGSGAVREVVELIVKAQGLWEEATARFMAEVEASGFRPREAR